MSLDSLAVCICMKPMSVWRADMDEAGLKSAIAGQIRIGALPNVALVGGQCTLRLHAYFSAR